MVIFNSYVKLPEGNIAYVNLPEGTRGADPIGSK